MIEAKIDRGRVKVVADGSVVQLTAELCMLISGLYGNYLSAGRTGAAETFRTLMAVSVASPESSVWTASGGEGVMVCIPKVEEADDGESV